MNGGNVTTSPRARSRYSAEGCIATVLFVVLIGVIMLQVTGRIGPINAPVWTEELARWLWVWMALLAVGEVERGNGQLRMEMLASLLPGGVRTALYRLIDLLFLGVTAHLLWIAWSTVQRTRASSAVTLPVSDAWLYAAFCFAAALILIRVSLRVLRGDYPGIDDAIAEAVADPAGDPIADSIVGRGADRTDRSGGAGGDAG